MQKEQQLATLPALGIREVEVSSIKPAAYNPRKISEDKTNKLKDSIAFVGFGKPIIINGTDGTIIAGHQRSRAARLLGYERLPAFVMTSVTEEDEVRFNQIHNSSDIDADTEVSVPPSEELGFVVVDHWGVSFKELPRQAPARAMITMLFLRHGQFSAAIATQDGEVLSGGQYAVTMHAMSQPLAVYYIPTADKEKAKWYLHEQYGEFSYDHLKKNTYVQSFAQKFRLRGESHSKSTLYEKYVIPGVTKDELLFDFGCGQADYLKKLSKEGYRIFGLEFYYRTGNSLNLTAIGKMVDHLLKHIHRRRHDVVICDSVMNSVDSPIAERDVVVVCSALLKMGGSLFISGRKWEEVEEKSSMKTMINLRRRVEFLDERGFTALYRNGEWFYQKYHTAEMARELMESCGFEVIIHDTKGNSSSWQIIARKVRELPKAEVLDSVEREFSLPLPGGNRHKFGPRAREAFAAVYDKAMNNPSY